MSLTICVPRNPNLHGDHLMIPENELLSMFYPDEIGGTQKSRDARAKSIAHFTARLKENRIKKSSGRTMFKRTLKKHELTFVLNKAAKAIAVYIDEEKAAAQAVEIPA